MPFDIEGHGWELQVKRLGLQRGSNDLIRTYGASHESPHFQMIP
jgi:hypothetical protein